MGMLGLVGLQRLRQSRRNTLAVFAPNIVRVLARDDNRAAKVRPFPIPLEQDNGSLRLSSLNLRNETVDHLGHQSSDAQRESEGSTRPGTSSNCPRGRRPAGCACWSSSVLADLLDIASYGVGIQISTA